MAGSSTITVKVLGDAKGFSEAVTSVEGKISSLGDKASGFGSKIAGVFGGLQLDRAAQGIVHFGEDSIKAFTEAQASQAKLADAFERFPKLADTNQKALQNLNSTLERKTKFDDDALAAGQATLAQFDLTGKQVAGLTPLLADYAAKTGKDIPTAADVLGKAMLGKGKALAEVGVKFKDTGSVAGNYAEIMTGLSEKVGGFATKEGKTAAGQLEILHNQFGELEETVGSKLLPILAFLATAALRIVDVLQAQLGPMFDRLHPVIQAVGDAFRTIGEAWNNAGAAYSGDNWLSQLGSIVQTVHTAMTMFINTLRTGFTEDEGTPIEKLALVIRDQLWPIVEKVATFIGNHWKPILIALGVVVGLLVAPFATVTVALLVLYEKVGWVHTVIDALVTFFVNVLIPAVVRVASYLTEQFGHAIAWVRTMWPQISEAISHVMNAVSDVINVVLAVVQAVWHAVGDDLFSYVSRIFNAIYGVIKALMEVIRGIIQTVVALINGDWGKAWDGIKEIVKGVWDGIWAIISGALGALKSLLGAAWSLISAGVSAAWGAIVNYISDSWDRLVDFAKGLPGRMARAYVGLFDGIKDAFRAALNWIVDAWNRFSIKLPEIDTHIPGIGKVGGFSLDTPDLPHFAAGGIVTGPTIGLIGEAGPEAVIPLSRAGALGGMTVHVHMPPGSDGEDVVRALQQYQRRNNYVPITAGAVL